MAVVARRDIFIDSDDKREKNGYVLRYPRNKDRQMQIFSDALGAMVDIPDTPRRIDNYKGKKRDPRRHLPNGNRLVAQRLLSGMGKKENAIEPSPIKLHFGSLRALPLTSFSVSAVISSIRIFVPASKLFTSRSL